MAFRCFVLSIFLVLASQVLWAQEQCEEALSSSFSADVAIQSLARLRLKLDLAQNDHSLYLSALKDDFNNKFNEVNQHLESTGTMTRSELLKRIKIEIQRIQTEEQESSQVEDQRRAEQKKEVDKETEILNVNGSRVFFHEIKPGSFEMGEVDHQIHTEITKPFEMAATLTTQLVWRKIVELAKKRYPQTYEALNADPSHFKGNLNPVEEISYNDVQLWLEAANALLDAGDPEALKLMPGYRKGTALRLPTDAEWEFVVRARGAVQGAYHFGDDASELDEYAWNAANSDEKTHPVAEKRPLIVDGKEFYDFNGNVWEWVRDWYEKSLSGGKDPQGPADGTRRVLRGGGWYVDASSMQSGFRTNWGPDNSNNSVGFRLVRAAK